MLSILFHVRGVVFNMSVRRVNRFFCRFNNHRANRKRSGQQHICRHFSSDGNSNDDLTIMPIEKIDIAMTIGFHYMLKDCPERNIGIRSCVQ